MLLNTVKCHGYNLYHFWVIKGKSTGGQVTSSTPIRVKRKCIWFSVDYNAIDKSDILDIHKFLIVKDNIKQNNVWFN